MPKGLGNSLHLFKHGITSNLKFQKSEEDARLKASTANEHYKAQLQATNAIRNAYFEQHLPRLIKVNFITGSFNH